MIEGVNTAYSYDRLGWIEKFVELTSGIPSPDTFRRWAGVATISGALGRSVYTTTASYPIYPNLFILLVAPPGVGKSVAIDEVNQMWVSTNAISVAPASMTRAALIDTLLDTKDINRMTNQFHHTLAIGSSEFGNLVSGHDVDLMNAMNRLYDCPSIYEARTRGGGLLKIDHPCMMLIAGTQPKFLPIILPNEAFGMGFTSRIIMVYSGTKVKVSLFQTSKRNFAQERQLSEELKDIADMNGELTWTKEAMDAIEEWHNHDCPPVPKHAKLQNYNTRRIAHIIKLSVIVAAANHSMTIDLPHFEAAKDLLLEAEYDMPEIFKDMASGEQSDSVEEVFNFLIQKYMQGGKKPIPKSQLVHFLSRRVPLHQIDYVLQTLKEIDAVRAHQVGAVEMWEPKMANLDQI